MRLQDKVAVVTDRGPWVRDFRWRSGLTTYRDIPLFSALGTYMNIETTSTALMPFAATPVVVADLSLKAM